MSTNPFTQTISGQMPLREEAYQQIHASALRLVVRSQFTPGVPAHIPVERLRQQESLYGPDVYISHPAHLASAFAGVTQAVYHKVLSLYCSRLGRSIQMIWQILKAMAESVGATPISYEAIWAICLFLEGRRKTHLDVCIERGHKTWWIGMVPLPFRLQRRQETEEYPSLLCIVELETSKMLSFRVTTPESSEEEKALLLYDAFIALRRPQPRIPTGILWQMPQSLTTEIFLPRACQHLCQYLDIEVEETRDTLPMLQTIQHTWAQGLVHRLLPEDHCILLLDTYLDKMYGFGPFRKRREQEQHYTGLLGYWGDPAWQFPLLRILLPERTATIGEGGVILYKGLHYHNAFLLYWPKQNVQIRLCAYEEAMIWVYLNGEILCQAHAQEFRRRDGSYRGSPGGHPCIS